MTAYEIIMCFIIYSFLGWVMESIYCSCKEKTIINRGFVNGPFCPIYGTGALLVHFFFQNIKDNEFLLFLSGMIVMSIFEYIVGFLLEKLFGCKYWDYSHVKFNYKGRICLVNSIIWGLLTIVLLYILEPLTLYFLHKIPVNYGIKFIKFWIIYFTFDFCYTVFSLIHFKEKLQEFMKKQIEFLEELKKEKSLENFKISTKNEFFTKIILENNKEKLKNKELIEKFSELLKMKDNLNKVEKRILEMINKK